MDANQINGLLISHGYKKEQYGYVRTNGKRTKQAVTLFNDSKVQLFGWSLFDPLGEKIYNTGIIKVKDLEQLTTLVVIFNQFKTY